MNEENYRANWLGEIEGICLRESVAHDDLVVLEIHGEKDTAAMEVANEIAKNMEEMARAMQLEIQEKT